MSSLEIPLAYYAIGITFIFSIFILLFLYRTSEFVNRAIFLKSLSFIVALFFLLTILVYLSNNPIERKNRIAVFPLIDLSFDENNIWKSWAIAENANSYLLAATDNHIVYPVSWVWESIDTDSTGSVDYLLNFAQRIGLSYAAIGSFDSRCNACPVLWSLYSIENKEILLQSEDEFTEDDYSLLGQLVGEKISAQLGFSTPEGNINLGTNENKWNFLTKKSLIERDFEQALKYAEKAFLIDSTDVISRELLAAAQFEYGNELEKLGKSGDFNKLIALKTSEHTVLNFDKASSESYRIMGNYYLWQKMWAKAQQHLTSAIKLDPYNIQALLDYSHLHDSRIKELGLSNKQKLLQHVIRQNPCSENARLMLADHFYFKNLPDQAQRECKKLLYIHPNSINGLLFLGKILIAHGDIEEIIATYEKIFQIDPNNADAYYNLGIFYFNKDDYENAEKLFTKAIRVGNHLDSHLYLGNIYETQGLVDDAINEYRLRIRFKKGVDDKYADVARERLFNLTKPDSTVLKNFKR